MKTINLVGIVENIIIIKNRQNTVLHNKKVIRYKQYTKICIIVPEISLSYQNDMKVLLYRKTTLALFTFTP